MESDYSMDTLTQSLAVIGANPILRKICLDLCREVERTLAKRDFDVRENVTGSIIDALHRDVGPQMTRLKQGLEYHFHYRSKIARELVMSDSCEPDHVWEPQTTKALLHFSKSASNLVIGGAYAGDQAILASSVLMAAGGSCHCFEPNKDQLKMLKYNASVNGLTNVVLNAVGLWESDDTNLVLRGEDSYARPELATAGDEGDSFSAICLNTYGERLGLDRIDLILLDIEGGELPALRGSSRYLQQTPETAPNLIFEVHRRYVDWSDGLRNTEIIGMLEGFGYSTFAIRDYQSNVAMEERPVELIEPQHAVLEGPAHGFNMLAVKETKVLSSDLFRFCKGVSPKLLFHRDPRLHAPMH